ncbi:M14 family metallocarboxypeptidase [Arenimonas sp. GDDSR-1]|uniref:M14 family metallopeptidase n=1 Tax=Arenimonas sp. GDDSR-1 TaxID=2950125 RepID=UPI00260776D4|nr:M14 family metallocarboxypeptidase [Arenimonas sp. GDDSR-1]
MTAWNSDDRTSWLASRVKSRSVADEVLRKIDALRERFDVAEYGQIDYGGERYPLLALKSRGWRDDLPVALVTGGVHGYETSGVQGALAFMASHGGDYTGKINILLAPCVSPWAYERVQRWNAEALDPNRSFTGQGGTQESAALIRLLAPYQGRVLLHIDLHETTDSDETEFRPAKAARDGVPFVPGEIPDGFYLCGDEKNPQLAFQSAVNLAVAEVTHIAPSDAKGEIIGSTVVAPGVILYDYKALGLCAGMTDARFTTTTEVYPDSPRATPEQCNAAQVAAVRAAIAFALAN